MRPRRHQRLASRVRVLSWPDHWTECPVGGDVTDWVTKGGGTPELLFEILDKLPNWTAPEPNDSDDITDDGDAQAQARGEGVTIDDFQAYMPTHSYIFTPSRDPWPASSVNAKVPPVPVLDADGKPVLDDKGKQKLTPAATWLDRHRSVEQMTWAPGMPMLIRDRLISEGGWIERKKVTCLNLYRPPAIIPGDAAKAGPWIDHLHKVFGDDAIHIEMWLAQRVQKPHDKVNHALVLGGAQGIGKDTALEPVKRAVGPWNFFEVSPQQMLGRFNGFLKSVILRVSEARDLGDVDRFQFYDHMKAYGAVYPIGALECPAGPGGERGRLIRAAADFLDTAVADRLRFFTDADFDRLLGNALPRNVVLTDGRDLECYALTESCLERICRICFPACAHTGAALIRDIRSTVRPIGILRILSTQRGLNLAFRRTLERDFTRFIKLQADGSPTVDMAVLVQVLLQNSEISLARQNEIMELHRQAIAAFAHIADMEIIHGKDSLRFLGWRFDVHPDEVERLLFMSASNELGRIQAQQNILATRQWLTGVG